MTIVDRDKKDLIDIAVYGDGIASPAEGYFDISVTLKIEGTGQELGKYTITSEGPPVRIK